MTIAEKIEMRKRELKASFEAFDREFADMNARIDASAIALNAVETKRGLSNTQTENSKANARSRELMETENQNIINENFQRFMDVSIMNHQF